MPSNSRDQKIWSEEFRRDCVQFAARSDTGLWPRDHPDAAARGQGLVHGPQCSPFPAMPPRLAPTPDLPVKNTFINISLAWSAQVRHRSCPPGEGCSARERSRSPEPAWKSIEHCVVNLAMDPRGCRVLQRALELMEDGDKQKVAQEFAGHVREVIESPHGNHVLQRCVELMRPQDLGFILEELVPSAFARPALVAKHRYGCRILERLIEHFPSEAMSDFVGELLDEAQDLSRHPYGNFVIQHVLEHGEQSHRQRVTSALQADIFGNATNPYACSVLDKALSYGDPDCRRALAQTMIAEPARGGRSLLVAMAAEHAGFAATQRFFKVVSGDDEFKAKRQLAAGQPEIGATKHGKALLQNLKDAQCPEARLQRIGCTPTCNTEGRSCGGWRRIGRHLLVAQKQGSYVQRSRLARV